MYVCMYIDISSEAMAGLSTREGGAGVYRLISKIRTLCVRLHITRFMSPVRKASHYLLPQEHNWPAIHAQIVRELLRCRLIGSLRMIQQLTQHRAPTEPS